MYPWSGDRFSGARAMLLVVVMVLAFSLPLSLALAPMSSHSVPRTARIAATGDPPYLFPPNVYVVAGVPFLIEVPVYDPNNDNVNVTWDFGDGTPTIANESDPAGSFDPMVNVSQIHTWSPVVDPGVGDTHVLYTMTLTGDDGNGNTVVSPVPVDVYVPPNDPPHPQIFVPTGSVDPADNVTIVANATDAEGEPLTWTFVFNNTDLRQDILTYVNFTPASAPNALVWNNVSHVFGTQGNYTVTLYVSDALPGNQVFPQNISVMSPAIRVVVNHAPIVSTVINVDPASPIVNSTLGYVSVNYSIDAFDLDGDPITVTWDFGDGGPPATNISAGGTATYTFKQTRNYSDTGSFNISVIVTDNRPGHSVFVYMKVNVTSTNLPPSIVDFFFNYPHNLTFALSNETQNFTWVFSDPENDPLEVIVDFGDNSSLVYANLTAYVDHNVTLSLTHSYSKLGTYTIIVQYTDNNIGAGLVHNKTIEATVKVGEIPPVIHGYWDWWDYTSLGLFLMIPVLITLRVVTVYRRRKQLEEAGMTLEEWKLTRDISESGKSGGI
jgi:hypothetical protein